MKLKMFLFAAIILAAISTNAQRLKVSPFHRLPDPNRSMKATLFGATSPTTMTAWRFTAAAASFDVVNNKVLTGIGYGFNKMHIKTDSTGNSTWYTDITINANVYAAGNVVPTYSYGNTNAIGFGPSIGILNKLLNVGYVFYPATNGGKSQSGVIVGIALSLN